MLLRERDSSNVKKCKIKRKNLLGYLDHTIIRNEKEKER
jgi:hypothetical protein